MDDIDEVSTKIYGQVASRDLIAAVNRANVLDALNSPNGRVYDDGYKTIPISGMNLIMIFMNIFSVIGTYLVLTYSELWPLTIGVGVAIAFSIIFDVIMLWDFISDKYKVRFK